MKITRYLQVAVLAGAVLTTNCNKDDDQTSSSNADVVKFSFNAGDASKRLTRSNPLATDDSQKEFNANDKIQVTTVGQDPVTYVLGSDGNWTEEAGYLVWKSNSQTFTAVYPSTATDPFTVPTDQSTVAKITAADYMSVTSTCTRPTPGADISLTLERKTARVIVKIAGFNNQYSTAAQKIVSDVVINGITPYPQGLNDDGKGVVNTTYTALVNPASAAATADFITLKDFDGIALKVIGIPEFVEGKSYTYELTVGKDEIKVGTVTVTDWNTGTIEGGRALADDEESVVGVSGEEILVSNGVVEGDHIGIKIGTYPVHISHGEIPYFGDEGTLTIFAQSNEKITKVEVTASYGGDKLTTTEGTASFSNGVFSITDINTSSIDLPLSAENDFVEITQIKVYYTGAQEVKPNSTVDLSTITSHVTIPDGCTLTGTLSGYRRITIAEGANVTLEDVTINGDPGNDTYQWAGINCKGNNTITLSGTNTVKGFSWNWPGIFIAAGATLTIDGSGSLDVSGGANSAGIGSGGEHTSGSSCGNIIINNGTIIARGGAGSPGIGASQYSSCGDITINGGTITSTRGDNYSADLGCGISSTCGNITKTGGTVTAEKVGVGYNGTCGTVSGF